MGCRDRAIRCIGLFQLKENLELWDPIRKSNGNGRAKDLRVPQDGLWGLEAGGTFWALDYRSYTDFSNSVLMTFQRILPKCFLKKFKKNICSVPSISYCVYSELIMSQPLSEKTENPRALGASPRISISWAHTNKAHRRVLKYTTQRGQFSLSLYTFQTLLRYQEKSWSNYLAPPQHVNSHMIHINKI